MPRILTVAAIAFIPLALGCTKSKLDIVPVRGRITYGGGDWPTAGNLYFQPKEAASPSLPLRPGLAAFGTDGKFVVKTGQRSGLVPGTYNMRVESWEEPPVMSSPGSGKSWVAAEYLQGPTPNYEIEVPVDSQGVDLKIDIPKRP
jgi:hypothetical protein